MNLTSPQRRILLSIGLGIVAGLVAYTRLRAMGILAADLTWPWRGARALLAGQDPYQVIQPTGDYPFDAPLYYPLPALLVFLPLAPLPAEAAAGLFMAISVALLVFGLTRDGYERLPMLISLPFLNCLIWPQWSPLLTAAVLLPGLLPLAIAKPSIGLAAFAARGTWRAAVAVVAILALSLALLPAWPWEWLQAIRRHGGDIPLLCLGGPLLLLALLRWRDWRGRLLAGLAIVPQVPYDAVMVWLVPRTLRQSLALALLSWGALVTWPVGARLGVRAGISWMNVWVYLPACGMLVWPDVLRIWRLRWRTEEEEPSSKRLSEE